MVARGIARQEFQRGFWDLEGVVPVIAVVFYAFEAFAIGKDSCGGSTREIP